MSKYHFFYLKVQIRGYYFHLSRQEHSNHFRFFGLFVTFPKLQIILFTIKSAINFCPKVEYFIFGFTENVNKQKFLK